MAEAEQDYSSLPLPDRFAHKVRFDPDFVGKRQLEVTMRTVLILIFEPTELESTKGGIRGCQSAIRKDPRRIRPSLHTISARSQPMERGSRRLQRGRADRGTRSILCFLEVWRHGGMYKVGLMFRQSSVSSEGRNC